VPYYHASRHMFSSKYLCRMSGGRQETASAQKPCLTCSCPGNLVNCMLLLSLTLSTVIMHCGHSLQPQCRQAEESIKGRQNSNKHISETDISCGQLIIKQDFVAIVGEHTIGGA